MDSIQKQDERTHYELKKFKEPKHFSLVRNFHLADFITLGNGACGSLSIFSNMHYLSTRDESWLWWSMALIPVGLTLDVLDGRVARWRKKASILGQELDSLADLISFGVAPAVCAFSTGMNTIIDTIVLTMFIMCGIARLARYNATVASIPKDASGKIKYFEGTPIPTTLVLVGIISYLVKIKRIGDELPGGAVELAKGVFFHPLVLMYAVSGTAMISKTLRIPKL